MPTNPALIVSFTILIAAISVAAACNSAEPVSEEQYVKWCASLDYGEPLAREAETWGDAAFSIALTLEQAESFEAPERFRRFHAVLKDVIKAGLDVAKSEPDSQRLEEGLIPANDGVTEEISALTVAYGDLPEDLKERLESNGCLVVA